MGMRLIFGHRPHGREPSEYLETIFAPMCLALEEDPYGIMAVQHLGRVNGPDFHKYFANTLEIDCKEELSKVMQTGTLTTAIVNKKLLVETMKEGINYWEGWKVKETGFPEPTEKYISLSKRLFDSIRMF